MGKNHKKTIQHWEPATATRLPPLVGQRFEGRDQQPRRDICEKIGADLTLQSKCPHKKGGRGNKGPNFTLIRSPEKHGEGGCGIWRSTLRITAEYCEHFNDSHSRKTGCLSKTSLPRNPPPNIATIFYAGVFFPP